MPDHIRKYVTLLCASVIGAALVRGATACSSGAGIAPGDAGGASDATIVDAPIDRAVAVDDAGVEPAPLDGWELYADYDDYCKFYVPKARVNLPAPIRWEPCRANPETSTKSCRQMVLDWKPSPLLGGELISETTRGIRRTNGRVALMSARYQSDGIVRFVAEVDGPMLVAVLAQALDRCLLDGVPSDGDRYAFKVLDSEAQQQVSSIGGGAIGGRLDDF
ncbi:MAG: hypothetical protein QOI41_4106, partial [Myxococcales bacterium]|nr:hypothetical protein [Myxococcales bacterium]